MVTIWFSIFFLALVVLALLWRLVNPPPRLEIDERGILQRDLGWGWIPWEEIEGAYPPTANEAETVRLRLTVTERLARILRKRRRLPREAPVEDSVEVRLDLAGSELNAIEVLQEILSHDAEAIPAGTSAKDRPTD